MLTEKAEKIEKSLYLYGNRTNQIQVVQIINIENSDWERIVFTGDRLLFEATAEAEIEIYTQKADSLVLSLVIGH